MIAEWINRNINTSSVGKKCLDPESSGLKECWENITYIWRMFSYKHKTITTFDMGVLDPNLSGLNYVRTTLRIHKDKTFHSKYRTCLSLYQCNLYVCVMLSEHSLFRPTYIFRMRCFDPVLARLKDDRPKMLIHEDCIDMNL